MAIIKGLHESTKVVLRSQEILKSFIENTLALESVSNGQINVWTIFRSNYDIGGGLGGSVNVDYNFFGHSVYNLHHFFLKNLHLQFYHTQVVSFRSLTSPVSSCPCHSLQNEVFIYSPSEDNLPSCDCLISATKDVPSKPSKNH